MPTQGPSVAAPDAIANVTLLGLGADADTHDHMPAAQEQASVHEQMYACTREIGTPASDTEDTAADEYQSKAKGPTGGSAAFQTQHTHVQSQLAGLRRRAARKQSA